ncbi:hypothetical protein [Rugosimonospora africana]|uniref:hypothetical protein n=1 Tax=Rugosimonospora africana TaxID=556532 RepID=UPI0019415AC4|nr:hypothetical protein [Rugosimonospora africana]
MADQSRKPTPLMMKRIQSIPQRPPAYLTQRSAFSTSIPPCGMSGAWAYLDTGVMYSASSRVACLNAFLVHYDGRLFVVSTVEGEVRRAADPANSAWIDGAVQNAARTARGRFLDSGAVVVDDDEPESKIFDEVYGQLSRLPHASGKGLRHERANVGEAFTIAICIKRRRQSRRVSFLSNDGGASVVATFHHVPTRNFGHVLRELVCAGHFGPDEAFEVLVAAQRISGIPLDDLPVAATTLVCDAAEQACATCDLIRNSEA